jgi:hypothetical protein
MEGENIKIVLSNPKLGTQFLFYLSFVLCIHAGKCRVLLVYTESQKEGFGKVGLIRLT